MASSSECLALAERLERAETQNLRLKQAALAVLILGSVPLMMGLARADQPAKVVEAEKFVLRDAGGTVRAEVGLTDGEPSVTLFDRRGKQRARLTLAANGGFNLSSLDEEGKSRVVMQLPAEESSPSGVEPKPAPNSARPAGAVSSPVVPASTVVGAQVQRGQALYRRLCLSCHGSDGSARETRSTMRTIPDFASSQWQGSRQDAKLVASILNGRGSQMPPFDDKLNAADARSLVTFIRSLGSANARLATTATDDFDARWQELQREWEELDRQMKALARPSQKP